jgi:hypothetical protein
MTSIALLYHDAIDRQTFRNHVSAIAKANPKVLLTIDDASLDAHAHMADELEAGGLRGQFFVRTSRIGAQRFLQPSHIHELRKRGHVIGTHLPLGTKRISCSTLGDVIHEWSRVNGVLADILGEPVRSGSVPGGHYPSKLARAAAIAAIETVFTSKPTLDTEIVEGCTLRGRFTIKRHSSATTAAALARGAFLPRLRQSVFWNLKRHLELTALVPQLHRHG